MLALAISPDGKYALSGLTDSRILLWDLRTSKVVKTISGHQADVRSVAFSPDGLYALSGSADATVKYWDLKTGALVYTFDGHKGAVNAVTFSYDGKTALSGSSDKSIIWWDLFRGKKILSYVGHTGPVNSVVFSKDMMYMLSGSADKSAILWDMATSEKVNIYKDGYGGITCVGLSADAQKVAFGTVSGVYFSSDEEYRGLVVKHTQPARSVFVFPDNASVLAGCADGSISFFDTRIGEIKKRIVTGENETDAISFSQDGKLALTANSRGEIKLWDLAGIPDETYLDHPESRRSGAIAFSPDGKYAVSDYKPYSIAVWNIPDGSLYKTITVQKASIQALAFSKDGKIVYSVSNDNSFRAWSLDSGEPVWSVGTWVGTCTIALTDDGLTALLGSNTNSLCACDLRDGICKKFIIGSGTGVRRAEPMGDGKTMLLLLWDNTLRLWDMAADHEIRQYPIQRLIMGLVVSPDRTHAIVYDNYKDIYLINLQSGEIVQKNRACLPGIDIASAVFSTDGKSIITGGDQLSVIQIPSGIFIRSFPVVAENVRVSPDGKYYLVFNNNAVILVNALQRKEVAIFRVKSHDKVASTG